MKILGINFKLKTGSEIARFGGENPHMKLLDTIHVWHYFNVDTQIILLTSETQNNVESIAMQIYCMLCLINCHNDISKCINIS